MFSLLSLLSACSVDHVGTMEDAYGQPRSLLANCAQNYDDNGYQILYDDQGYPSRMGRPEEQAFIELETTLDALERPVRIQSWFSYDGELGDERPLWEAEYLDDSWRIAQLHTMTEREGEPVILDYSWSRSAYQVTDLRELAREEERQCPRYVQLDVGLRPALSQTFCDGALSEETAYLWSEGRLSSEGSADKDGPRAHYSYNADGRLAEVKVDKGEGQPWGVADQSFTWDCE